MQNLVGLSGSLIQPLEYAEPAATQLDIRNESWGTVFHTDFYINAPLEVDKVE